MCLSYICEVMCFDMVSNIIVQFDMRVKRKAQQQLWISLLLLLLLSSGVLEFVSEFTYTCGSASSVHFKKSCGQDYEYTRVRLCNGFFSAIRWTRCGCDRGRSRIGPRICIIAGQSRCQGGGQRLGGQLQRRGPVQGGRCGCGRDPEGGRRGRGQLRLGDRWREDHPNGNGGIRPG